MDLVSSIRKQGSRGGVNFNWDDVATSTHRENYLGHSLKAPVGRWQQGRDLTWYAKDDGGDNKDGESSETPEERAERERKEEIRRIKEAEEEAIAQKLGIPVAPKNTTGANSIAVSGGRGIVANEKAGGSSKSAGKDNERTDRRSSRRDHDPERRHRRRHHSRSRSRSRDRRRDRSPRRHEDRRHRESHRSRDDRSHHHHRRRRSHSRNDDNEERHRRHRCDRETDGAERDSRKGEKTGHRPRSRDRRRSRSPRDYKRRDRS